MKKLVNSLFDHLREGELRLAKSILRWKLQKEDSPLPEDGELNMAASQLLDEAREIARKRGKKLLDVLKEEAKEFFNSEPP
jgi:hypothetical protein